MKKYKHNSKVVTIFDKIKRNCQKKINIKHDQGIESDQLKEIVKGIKRTFGCKEIH